MVLSSLGKFAVAAVGSSSAVSAEAVRGGRACPAGQRPGASWCAVGTDTRLVPSAWQAASQQGCGPCCTHCCCADKCYILAGCLRQHLAPLALSAYPEAYPEMKAWLPQLLRVDSSSMQDRNKANGPGSNSQREKLAGLLRRTVRQNAGACRADQCMMTKLTLLDYHSCLYEACRLSPLS